MTRPLLDVADIFRVHGAAWRRANAGHVSLGQLSGRECLLVELSGQRPEAAADQSDSNCPNGMLVKSALEAESAAVVVSRAGPYSHSGFRSPRLAAFSDTARLT